MSTQRGNSLRTRAQKHKNRTSFRNDLHDKTPQQIRLNSMHISEVCQHCKDVIEWKIKYKKYKALTQPKTCTKCQQRNILKAYHVLCRSCALDFKLCAKCLKSGEEVEIELARPTANEEQKLEAEMKRLVKTFPERKRRAFFRYMARGKREEAQQSCHAILNEDNNGNDDDDDDGDYDSDNNSDGSAAEELPKVKSIPYTREELLQKIEELRLSCKNEEFNDSDSELYSEDDSFGSEDNSGHKTNLQTDSIDKKIVK